MCLLQLPVGHQAWGISTRQPAAPPLCLRSTVQGEGAGTPDCGCEQSEQHRLAGSGAPVTTWHNRCMLPKYAINWDGLSFRPGSRQCGTSGGLKWEQRGCWQPWSLSTFLPSSNIRFCAFLGMWPTCWVFKKINNLHWILQHIHNLEVSKQRCIIHEILWNKQLSKASLAKIFWSTVESQQVPCLDLQKNGN